MRDYANVKRPSGVRLWLIRNHDYICMGIVVLLMVTTGTID